MSTLQSQHEVSIDSSSWFEDLSQVDARLYDYLPQLQGISGLHTFERYLTPRLSTALTLATVCRSGLAKATISGALRQSLAPDVVAEATLSLGAQRQAGLLLQKTFARNTVANLHLLGQLYGGLLLPRLQLSVSHLVGTSTVAAASLYTGYTSGGAISLGRVDPRFPSSLAVTVNDQHVALTCKALYDITDGYAVKAKFESSQDANVTLGLVRTFGESSKGGLFLVLGESGVTLKLTYVHDNFQFAVPVLVAREASFSSIGFASAIPTVLAMLFKHLVVSPYLEMIRKQRAKEILQDQIALIQQRRQETDMAIALLQPFYEKRVAEETASNGSCCTMSIVSRFGRPKRNLRSRREAACCHCSAAAAGV